MGGAVSIGKGTTNNSSGEGEKKTNKIIPVASVNARTGARNGSNTSPNSRNSRLRVDVDEARQGAREQEEVADDDALSVLRSIVANNQVTPPRVASSRSLGSSSPRNPSSGPSSGDSRGFGARDAVDYLYRRSQMSTAVSTNESESGSAADVFAQTAMSLGMDNDDLLFNMMYFDDGSLPNFGTIMNTMQQETLALHSENNTPYKLNPANQETITHLLKEHYVKCSIDTDNECAVCKDDIDDNAEILRIPTCRHYFHSECLSRWVQLQAWCPVCRSSLEVEPQQDDDKKLSTFVPQTLCFEDDVVHPRITDDASTHKLRHRLAYDTAEKLVSAGLLRVVHRESLND